MTSAKWWPYCLSHNELTKTNPRYTFQDDMHIIQLREANFSATIVAKLFDIKMINYKFPLRREYSKTS